MKKEYIQPEVKEVKLNLNTILAGSIQGNDGYSLGDNGNVSTEEGNGDDALGFHADFEDAF